METFQKLFDDEKNDGFLELKVYEEFAKKVSKSKIEMTRFIISLNEAVKFVLLALEKMQGGEIFIKKIPSMNILDIAKAINPKPKLKYIGIRPGEKLHEQMISEDDAVETYEFKNFFKIISPALPITKKNKVIKGSKKVSEKFSYKSNSNKNWLNSKELKNWIKKNPYYF